MNLKTTRVAGMRWRKVLRDLLSNKTRTILVVLSIAVGVFAVGTVAHMQVIVSDDLDASYAAVNPASATLYTDEAVDEDLIQTIGRMPEVAEAEGRRRMLVQFKTEADGAWHPLILYALEDYEDIRINKVRQEIVFEPDPAHWPTGVWPPLDRALTIERTSLLMAQLGLTRSRLNDSLIIKTPAGKERAMPISGLAYDFARIPATFSAMAVGYVTFETLEWLGEPRSFNELHIIVAGDKTDIEHIQRLANLVEHKIEKSGREVTSIEVHTPGKLPLDNYFQAISLILGVLGFLSLFLSGFLVVNTISALLAQQVKQIGVMKAIGAEGWQLTIMYLAMVLVFGLLALIIAIPLSTRGAEQFAGFLSYFLNFQLSQFSIPAQVVVFEVAMALLVPLLAGLFPIMRGTQITVREAISDYGLGKGQFGANLIDRSLVNLHRLLALPRPFLLSLRNAVRRKGRLSLTLVTLIIASTVFIGVFNVRASLFLTIEDLLQYFQYDVQILFKRPYRAARIERIAREFPGVANIECWIEDSAIRLRPDGSEGTALGMTALPPQTEMLQAKVLEGRWLLPRDQQAVVISSDVLKEEADIAVGDTIVLKRGDEEREWVVVGVVQGILAQPLVYANYDYVARITGAVGQASSAQLIINSPSQPIDVDLAQELQAHFEDAGLGVITTFTATQRREQIAVLFNIITSFLFSMAVLLAVVGGLGLMGTMSLNVLERIREIGVMRAIGAGDEMISQIIIVEGVLIGLTSWGAGLLLALPLSNFLSAAVGLQFLQVPLSTTFSVRGAAIWLGLVIALSALASYLPAQHASRLTIREVLAYEG